MGRRWERWGGDGSDGEVMSTTLLLKKLLSEIEQQNDIALHYYQIIKFKIVVRVKYIVVLLLHHFITATERV